MEESDVKSSVGIVCVIFDVTEMQRVNDQHGYEFGNEVLEFVDAQLKLAFGPPFVRRLGGDEFLVMQSDNISVEVDGKARVIAQTVWDRLGIQLNWGLGVGRTPKEAKRAAISHLFETRRRAYS